MVRWLALVMLAGCGFHTGSATIDGSIGSDANGGEQTTQGMCWNKWHLHTIAFGSASTVANLSVPGSSDKDLALSFDERTLYFSSDRGVIGDFNIYQATRASTTADFSTAAPVGSVNSATQEFHLSVAKDTLHGVLSTDRATSSGIDLWNAVRTSPIGNFSLTRTGMQNLDDPHDQHDPALTDDGLTLYYAPFLASQSKQAVMTATRADITAAFGNPSFVVNSTEGDGDPYISPDQTVLIFSSTRSGGQGLIDAYYTVRDSTSDPWQDATPLADIDTGDNEADTIASRDGCTIYFASDRDKGRDVYGIYTAASH